MNFSTYRFTLDLQKHKSQISIAAFQYDTAIKLSIGLTDGGVPYHLDGNLRAELYGKKPSGNSIVHDCSIEENSRIIYTFEKTTANEIGVTTCQICIYDANDEQISAPKFTLVVGEKAVSDDDVFEDEDFEGKYSALDTIFTSESERVEAESKRIEAEKERVKAEEERKNAFTQDFANKLDKTTEANKIYGTDGNGEQITYSADELSKNTVNKTELAEGIAEAKVYADTLVNPITEKQTALEERVTDLESLTLTFPEDSSTAYEKGVPAEVGKYALIKGIGGATEKVMLGKNLINPADIEMSEEVDSYTINQDGSITYTINRSPTGYAFIMLNDLPVGRYYFYVEGTCLDVNGKEKWEFHNDYNYIELWVESDFDETLDDGIGDYLLTTRLLKVMLWKDESVTTDTLEIVEAPSGTVYVPYDRQDIIKNADVESIDSLGKNRLPSDFYDVKSWTVRSSSSAWHDYSLDLADGWYCVSLKLKEGYKGDIYLYLYKSINNGKSYSSTDAAYDSNGKLEVGYLVTEKGIYRNPLWFKVDKKAGIIYRFGFNGISQSKLDMIYDLQIERVNLAQAPSSSYKPSTYAPPSDYAPYSAEPIDTFVIPEAVRAIEGYGREGSYIEWVDDTVTLTVTKDENLEELAKPIITDITDLFTEDNRIEIVGRGVLRFVNKDKKSVPSTIGYVTRKG